MTCRIQMKKRTQMDVPSPNLTKNEKTNPIPPVPRRPHRQPPSPLETTRNPLQTDKIAQPVQLSHELLRKSLTQ